MQEFKVDGHEPSLLPEGKKWEYVWGDEFDGDTLDRSKWSFRLNFWGRRFLPYTDQGVELDGNSNVKIHLIEKDGQYMSAQLQTGANSFDAPAPVYETETNVCGDNFFWKIGDIEKPKFMHRYGYYEVRCKLQQQPGWWSAFWLQSPSIGMSYDPAYSGVEVDIMENFTRDGEVTSGNIFGGYGTNLQHEARVHYHVKDTADGSASTGARRGTCSIATAKKRRVRAALCHRWSSLSCSRPNVRATVTAIWTSLRTS